MLNPNLSTRINLIIDNELLAMIDDEVQKMGMNRSAVVRFCCRQYFQTQKTMQSFQEMMEAYKAEKMKQIIESEPPKK